MTLYQKTKEIVNDSIKSAVFIDEKAVESYSRMPNLSIVEERLSKNLFRNFKKKGVSLAVHKFKPADITDDEKLNYLFNKRDLILLDWKLDGISSGEQYSLFLLSQIVQQKHIHFCSIYTSERSFDNIINNIVTYFSGYNQQYYDDIEDTLDPYYQANRVVFDNINFNDKSINSRLYPTFLGIDSDLPNLIKEITGLNDFGEALIQVKYTFSNLLKADVANTLPTHINRVNYTLNINNTIITIIEKNQDTAPKILRRLTKQISESENCFTELLGLDMQNSFSNNSSFIDENLVKTSMDTLMFHRKQIIDGLGSEQEFQNFLKSILLEQAKLTLDNSDLKVLNTTFLNRISKNRYKILDEELSTLNSFYNGSVIKTKSSLNFGDIFYDDYLNEFYLCITPLCDCLHPDNIKNNFLFVKGKKAPDLAEIIKTGDGGFKSYIDAQTCVLWAKDVSYVKPIQLYIPCTDINEKNLSTRLIKDNYYLSMDLEYVFTLKANYAQRIANHAFNYPLRVGVDFVKKG